MNVNCHTFTSTLLTVIPLQALPMCAWVCMCSCEGPSGVRYVEGSCGGGDGMTAFWVFFFHAPAPILANIWQAQEGMEDLT